MIYVLGTFCLIACLKCTYASVYQPQFYKHMGNDPNRSWRADRVEVLSVYRLRWLSSYRTFARHLQRWEDAAHRTVVFTLPDVCCPAPVLQLAAKKQKTYKEESQLLFRYLPVLVCRLTKIMIMTCFN